MLAREEKDNATRRNKLDTSAIDSVVINARTATRRYALIRHFRQARYVATPISMTMLKMITYQIGAGGHHGTGSGNTMSCNRSRLVAGGSSIVGA